MEGERFTPDERLRICGALDKYLGPEYIQMRPGQGGGPSPYVEGYRILELANDVFGFDGWSTEIKDLKYEAEPVMQGKHNGTATCHLRITVKGGTFQEDVGFGSSTNMRNYAQAREKAMKAAVTDATKRTLRRFGNLFGGNVQDKEFMTFIRSISKMKRDYNVDDLKRPGPKRPRVDANEAIRSGVSNTAGSSRSGPVLQPSGNRDQARPAAMITKPAAEKENVPNNALPVLTNLAKPAVAEIALHTDSLAFSDSLYDDFDEDSIPVDDDPEEILLSDIEDPVPLDESVPDEAARASESDCLPNAPILSTPTPVPANSANAGFSTPLFVSARSLPPSKQDERSAATSGTGSSGANQSEDAALMPSLPAFDPSHRSPHMNSVDQNRSAPTTVPAKFRPPSRLRT